MAGDAKVVFVFGSNLAGRHGAGAALWAKRFHGAVYGRGQGPEGHSYAIPTKDWDVYTPLSLERIKVNVEDFKDYARRHPGKTFQVTRIACGRAGYKDAQIAPMFLGAPINCKLPIEWKKILGDGRAPEGFQT